ncbi:MAG: hypothetical protein ABH956_01135 [Candidatus Nealsonbacteria bacterium]
MKKRETYLTDIKYNYSLKELKRKINFCKHKIYFKQIDSFQKFDIWLVDGNYIRRNICGDFVNFGQYYFFKFIPKNELWIDKKTKNREVNFYIDHLLVENKLMSLGMSYKKALKKAEMVEKRERNRCVVTKRLKKINKKELIEKVHKDLMQTYTKKVKVWVVKGKLVRDFFDINFAGGTHDKVDFFVPKDEVWVSDDISSRERKFILFHEIYERGLMAKGKDYFSAHKSATKLEDYYRHNPKGIIKALKKEIEKQD